MGCLKGTAAGATGVCEVISGNNSTIKPVQRRLFVPEGCPTGFDWDEGMCLEIEQ